MSIFSPSGRNLENFECSRVNHSLYINITHLNSWVSSLCLMYIHTSAHSNFQASLCHEQNRKLQTPQICHSMAEAVAVAPYLIWECTIWKISYKKEINKCEKYSETVYFLKLCFSSALWAQTVNWVKDLFRSSLWSSTVRGLWFGQSFAVHSEHTFSLAGLQDIFKYREVLFLPPTGVLPRHNICSLLLPKEGQIMNLGFQKPVPSVALDHVYKFSDFF